MANCRLCTQEDARPHLAGLVELLRDSVHRGASIGFAAPLPEDIARRYWDETISLLACNEMVLHMALSDAGQVVGSVQLARCPKENGRHRAEVRKLMVHREFRRQGLGGLLMDQVEETAREWGLKILVLDTATGEPAEGFYSKRGYATAGIIPDYAAYPDGSLHEVSFMYKRLGY